MISWRIRKEVTWDTGASINRLVYGLRKLGTGHELEAWSSANHESEDIQRVFSRSIRAFGVAPEADVGLAFVPLKQRAGRLGLFRR